MHKYHKGIMVIKSSIEKVEKEKEKKDDDKADDKAAADDKADGENKDKQITKRFFRAYLPKFGKEIQKESLFYETSIELKSTPSAAPINNLGTAQTGPQKVEENETIITSDNNCFILSLIIKGLRGEQHKVIMFNPESRDPLSVTARAGNTDLEFNMNSHIRPFNQIFICQTENNG